MILASTVISGNPLEYAGVTVSLITGGIVLLQSYIGLRIARSKTTLNDDERKKAFHAVLLLSVAIVGVGFTSVAFSLYEAYSILYYNHIVPENLYYPHRAYLAATIGFSIGAALIGVIIGFLIRFPSRIFKRIADRVSLLLIVSGPAIVISGIAAFQAGSESKFPPILHIKRHSEPTFVVIQKNDLEALRKDLAEIVYSDRHLISDGLMSAETAYWAMKNTLYLAIVCDLLGRTAERDLRAEQAQNLLKLASDEPLDEVESEEDPRKRILWLTEQSLMWMHDQPDWLTKWTNRVIEQAST